MRRSRKEVVRQRKICMTVLLIVVILLAALYGGYHVWKQTKAMSETEVSAQKQQIRDEQDEDTIQHAGNTYRYNDHLSNYLFMGIDTRESVDTYESQQDAGQADAIFLISMDRVTQQLCVLSIPRDTMARIEVFNPAGKSLGGTTDHINIQYAYGDGKQKSCELMKTAVSELLDGIPIQGYCSMNMDGISAVTDFVEGVEITVPDDSLAGVDPEFSEGAVVTLTGENAEQFVRYRDTAQTQSALVRQERQKAYIEALIAKVQEKTAADAGFVADLYENIKSYTVTNMGTDIFVKLLDASQNGTIEKETVPGEGVQGKDFDEYHVDETALTELLLSMFYEKV